MKRTGSDHSLRCSFCNKSQDVVGKLISSPRDYSPAYICDECIAVCNSILEDERNEQPQASPILTMDDRITVGRATVSDAAGISMLYVQFLQSYGHDSELETVVRFLESMLAEPWVLFFIATTHVSDGIVGFAGCTLTYSAVSQATAITINDMFVDAGTRRRGVGTALCVAVEAYARRNGFVKIFLEAAPEVEAAIALYKKVGFAVQPYLAMSRELHDE